MWVSDRNTTSYPCILWLRRVCISLNRFLYNRLRGCRSLREWAILLLMFDGLHVGFIGISLDWHLVTPDARFVPQWLVFRFSNNVNKYIFQQCCPYNLDGFSWWNCCHRTSGASLESSFYSLSVDVQNSKQLSIGKKYNKMSERIHVLGGVSLIHQFIW